MEVEQAKRPILTLADNLLPLKEGSSGPPLAIRAEETEEFLTAALEFKVHLFSKRERNDAAGRLAFAVGKRCPVDAEPLILILLHHGEFEANEGLVIDPQNQTGPQERNPSSRRRVGGMAEIRR